MNHDRQTKEINELREQAIKLLGYVNELKKQFKNIEESSQNKENEVLTKQKELKAVESKLLTCQQKKDDLQKQLDNKIEELANSNLSQEQKSQQIIALTTIGQKQFSQINQQLASTWQNHQQIQQKVIEKLGKPCSICPEKEQDKKHLRQKIVYFSGLVVLLVILFFVFHIWFIRWAWKKRVRVKVVEKKIKGLN